MKKTSSQVELKWGLTASKHPGAYWSLLADPRLPIQMGGAKPWGHTCIPNQVNVGIYRPELLRTSFVGRIEVYDTAAKLVICDYDVANS